jgi:transcription elongation GreA/GreB family factor
LDNVEIIDGIDDKDINKKKVGFWSKVTIQMDNSDPKTVIIVGTWEVDIKDDIIYISFESPLGKALNGRKKGDVFRLKTEANSEVKILEIE